MATHDFTDFSWDEQEDVKAVLTSRGFDVREFKITDNDDCPEGGMKGATRQITVTRITNGKMAIYDTDHFATWIAGFADALEAGAFDD
ncbi:hypothetical protein [Burkholderia sp. PU8-34]